MLVPKRCALIEAEHITAQVVDPDVYGAVLLLLRFLDRAIAKEKHVSLDPLGIENAGRQAQDGVQVALVHQVAMDLGTDTGLEQDVIRQHYSGRASGLEAAVDVLQEGELLVL